jgi:hypothetical protein
MCPPASSLHAESRTYQCPAGGRIDMPAWISALALSGVMAGSNVPVAQAQLDAACHASVDAAAVAALTAAMVLAPDIEHGGAIYERGKGCFVYSVAVTIGEPMRVLYKVRTSAQLRLAGLYHTHTDHGAAADFFSVQDVRQSRLSRVPSFVGVHGANHIRKLRAGFADYSAGDRGDGNMIRRRGVKGMVLVKLVAMLGAAVTATESVAARGN